MTIFTPLEKSRRARDRLRPVLLRLLLAIESHFATTGTPPSLRDLGYRTGTSAQRVSDLLPELVAAGVITRAPGIAHSIRLVDGLGNFSDDELLRDYARLTEELVRRGHREQAALIAAPLHQAYPVPLTPAELPADPDLADMLAQIDGEMADGDGGGEYTMRGTARGFAGS